MPGLSGFTYTVLTPTDSAKASQSAIPDDADFTVIGGSQEKSLELTAQDIDITNQSSDENRELLDGHGTKSHQVTFSGILQDDAVFKALEVNWANQKLRWFRLIQADNSNRKYTSKYKITSFSNSAPHDGATTFNATLTSSGPLTIA